MKNTKWIYIISGIIAVWLLSAAEAGFVGAWGLWTSLGIALCIGGSVFFAAEQSRIEESKSNLTRKYKACRELCIELKNVNVAQSMCIRNMECDIKEALEQIERTSNELDKLRLKNVELGIELQKRAM